jgi:hypothetical protein
MNDDPGDGDLEAHQAAVLTDINSPLERQEEAEQGLTTTLNTPSPPSMANLMERRAQVRDTLTLYPLQ